MKITATKYQTIMINLCDADRLTTAVKHSSLEDTTAFGVTQAQTRTHTDANMWHCGRLLRAAG